MFISRARNEIMYTLTGLVSLLILLSCNRIENHSVSMDFIPMWDTLSPAEYPELVAEPLDLCGYWYYPVSAEFPKVMRKGKQTICITWLNKGLATANRNFGIIFLLENIESSERNYFLISDAGNNQWLPGAPYEIIYTFELSPKIADGTYELKFKLKDIQSKQQNDIFLALNESFLDSNHFIKLGDVQLRR